MAFENSDSGFNFAPDDAGEACPTAGDRDKPASFAKPLLEVAILVDHQGRILDWSPAAQTLFGHSPGDAHGEDLFRLIAPGMEARTDVSATRAFELVATSKTGEALGGEINFIRCRERDDFLVLFRTPAVAEAAALLLRDSWQQREEQSRRQAEMEETYLERQQRDERLIWQLMRHDPLTGLPNRLMIDERMSHFATQAAVLGRRMAVLVLGIDHLKYIRDTLGQGIGDFLLTVVAGRLTECLGPDDSIARLDGHDFAIVLPNLRQNREAEELAQRLLATLKTPIEVDRHHLAVTGNIGIAVYPDDGTDLDALIKNADSAMCLAKQEGSNSWQLYAAEYHACALERLALEDALRQAVERGEFEIHYQPQVNLATGRISGAEALIRWRRPGHGFVPPARFIPLAEETGLIIPIGEWVLRRACAQLQAWREAGAGNLRMAVNLSARQFRESALEHLVADALSQTGVPPACLELEITESLLMQDQQKAGATLAALRQHGIRIAIDDFGTGYSSLSYLKHFPITTLKIDQSFVRLIPHDRNDVAIVQAIIALAHGLELNVVAEGVETERQMSFMRDHGCDEIQGYFYSPPVEAGRFAELLAANQS